MSASNEKEEFELGVDRIDKVTINPFPLGDYGDLDRLEVAKRLLAALTVEAELLELDEKERLLDVIDLAAYDLSRTDNGAVAVAFYLLGITAGNLSNPVRDFDAIHALLGMGLDAIQGEALRTLPIKLRNIRKEQAKGFIQKYALVFWQKPKHKEMRVSEMAEYIWGFAQSFDGCAEWLRKELPDKAAGLVPWLREVAPAAAKKPGRPPTTKK